MAETDPPLPGPDPPAGRLRPRESVATTPRRWDWRPKVRWFAAEILIVVVGVLIALAINAWWSRVQDRKVEAQSLREVRAALVNDLDDIRVNVEYHQRAASSSDAL